MKFLLAGALALMMSFPAQAGWKKNLFGIPEYGTSKKPAQITTRRVRQTKPVKRNTRINTSRVRRVTGSGLASYYWQPQRVASGGWFNPNALTAAHKTLPFGTRVRVTNRTNNRSVVVTINDRGPYIRGRVIDLSKRAAQVIQMTKRGVVPVSIKIL